ncbi:disulfide oxidoreductase [Alkalibacillus haloalkaliphilus]|uniref:Probable disulfide formation protein n=1 Tax=Alkalibacillus haloalkaliphilus TaxID=94136 RepID=A0A511W4S3_9BACI|nr:disulfide oxidoreductase [Alkalibacillus haloalkaliphilus]GEN46099.1 putative disulfide formation protein [Alkalibacillus haloalkaliphilus]
MNKRAENLAVFSWIIALVATLGSLYFSEIKHFEPCLLCWYQRIIMYPLVLIYLIGIIIKDHKVFIYGIAFSIIGLLTSWYHYAIQKVTLLQDSSPSCGQVSCLAQYINWGGFITIPFLAGTAFTLILIISVIGYKYSKED